MKVNPKIFEVLQEWSKPKTLTDVGSFMGLLQLFGRFIKGFSKLVTTLTNLTKKGKAIDMWNLECYAAF